MTKRSPYNLKFTLWETQKGHPIALYCNKRSVMEHCRMKAAFPACEFTTATKHSYSSHKDSTVNVARFIFENIGFSPGDYLVYGDGDVTWGAVCLPGGAAPDNLVRIPLNQLKEEMGLELVVLPGTPPSEKLKC